VERGSRRNLTAILFSLSVFCSVTMSATGGTENLLPLSLEDGLRMHSFGPLMPIGISPNGKWLAYVVQDNQRVRSSDDEAWARTGVQRWNTGTDVWIVDMENGNARSLTSGDGDNWTPSWSPDSRFLGFLSTRDGSGQARLWVWDAVKDQLRRISDLNIRAEQVEWTPDSRNILTTPLPGGLSVDDYVRRRTKPPGGEPLRGKSPGSTVILYQAHAHEKGEGAMPKSDPWNLNWALRDLTLIDASTGRARVLVRSQKIVKFLPSPDGSHVAYTTQERFEAPESQQILYRLATITLATMHERLVAPDIRLYFPGEFSWSPDSSRLSFVTGGANEFNNDVYIASVDAGTPRNITRFPPQQQHSRFGSVKTLWDTSGEFNYFIRNGALWRASAKLEVAAEIARVPDHEIVTMIPASPNRLWMSDGDKSTIVITRDESGNQDGFYRIDLTTSRSTRLREQGHCYSCAIVNIWEQLTAVAPDGQHLAYFEEDAAHPPDLWLTDTSFDTHRRLTRLNPELDSVKMGVARLIDWLSDDGEQLHGALLLPANYEEGKRYPLIVYTYGGLLSSDHIRHFGLGGLGPFNMQLLATRGYAVLVPDAPQHTGTPMLDLAKAILPGINKVIGMGIADPERLGLMGHSYGGYSTLSLLVQTTRFKAAVAEDGFGDLMASYGQLTEDGSAFGVPLAETGQLLMGGTPWEFPARYVDNSPLFHLNRVEAPLLIAHGAQDTVVLPFLAGEVFVGLRRLGKEVTYAKYEGEGHSPLSWTFTNQLDLCERVIGWFDKYLKPETQESPRP
jgi:dipeptidyl aminopeptidase/acylaminoacyl peptidase